MAISITSHTARLVLLALLAIVSFSFAVSASACPGQEVCQCKTHGDHKHADGEAHAHPEGKQCDKAKKDGAKCDKPDCKNCAGERGEKAEGKRCPHTGKLLEPSTSKYTTAEDAVQQQAL